MAETRTKEMKLFIGATTFWKTYVTANLALSTRSRPWMIRASAVNLSFSHLPFIELLGIPSYNHSKSTLSKRDKMVQNIFFVFFITTMAL